MSTTNAIVRGAICIADHSERILDSDEEVFLLYSNLQARRQPDNEILRGLGHVDSRKDTITVTFELKAPAATTSDTNPTKAHRRSKARKSKSIPDKTVEIELSQDQTALRTRKGDTGSVLWKASIEFAQLCLQQLNFETPNNILKPSILKTQHVLELGAGTGLLAIALAPYVRRYTVTDIAPLLPLIRKNVRSSFTSHLESNIYIEELDWVLLKSLPQAQRRKLVDVEPVDLIIVVDCIYHPSLLLPLVETIDYLAVPGRTAVLVVVELRAEDVIREFLNFWLVRPGWEMWRVDGGLAGPYAMWLGWRKEINI